MICLSDNQPSKARTHLLAVGGLPVTAAPGMLDRAMFLGHWRPYLSFFACYMDCLLEHRFTWSLVHFMLTSAYNMVL